MIRRNQKAAASENDSEIEIVEDNRRTRKGTKQTRLKKPAKEPVKPMNDDTEILTGIDLEGVPEEEREEIRRALLLSREEEKQEQIEAQRLMDERREKHLNEGNLSSQKIKEEAESASQEIAPDDDDATQPPDSPQPQSSLEDEPDSTTCQVGKFPPTLSREDSKEDLFEFGPESTLRSSSPSLTLGMSVSQSLEVDRGESDEEMEMEEPDSTQNEENPYDRDTIIDANETQEYEMEQNLEDSGRDQTEDSQNSRHGSQTSQVSQSSAGFQVKADDKKSQKSSSQTSSESQTSGHSTASDQPLKRHYKNVRKQKGNQVKYFATEGMDPVQCTKVIMQLFDIYAKNLKAAQSKCKERLAWGEPVKSGQHQSKSIDVKRRGQGYQYMILSDSEDEDPKRADKQVIGAKNDRLKEDDNDLPDLENRCKRRLRKGANKEAFAAETQAYDPFDFEDSNTNQNIDDADDQDFVSKSGLMKQCPKPENPGETKNRKGNPKQTKISVNDAGTMILNAAETKVTEGKGRYRRRNKEAKILVEDTQKSVFELSSDEDNEKQKETPVVIGETQGFEEESVGGNRNRVPAANEGRHVGHKAKEHTGETIKNNITTSEIIKNLKENFYGNKNSVKIQSEAKVKPPHATSRKGRLKKPVTLVEDTQDMDEEIIGKVNQNKLDKVGDPENLSRPIRGKRKSFQLKSDSEEESIPETQDLDLSPNVTVIENIKVKDVKTDQNDNVSIATKIGNVGAAVFQKVKEYLSPKLEHNKEHIVDIDNDQVNDENSQSPVIRKKRKIYAEPNSKFEKDEGKGNDLIHDASQKVPLISSRLRGGVVTQESGVGKEREIQGGAGVKKLFSRPPSKESNASDYITASQGSSTLIDDQGDLYSTQLSEKPEIFKVRKAQRKTATTNINQSSLENISGNDDEVHILKEKKDLRRKPNLRKQVTVVKSDNISHFFPKVPKIEDKVVTVDSDSEDSEIIFHHTKTKQTVNRNANQNSSPAMDQNEDYLHARLKTENRKVTVNIPQVTNLISEDESSNDSLQNLLPGGKDRQELSGLKAGNENGPIIPSHFMDQGNDHALSVKGYICARPKVPRTRKVSETITSAQLERNADYSAVDKQRTMLRNKRTMGNMDEMAGHETAVRKRVHPVGRVSPVVMFPCPLCCQSFPADMIEIHASECVGDVEEEEEEEHAAFAHAINTRQLRKTHHNHLHDHHHHDDLAGNMIHHHDDEEEDIHHHHPEIVQQHLEELEMEEEQEQEEVQELMEHIASQNPVKIEDTHVKDVAKDIKISPGEPGEIQQCYICDAALPKGVLLEQHMQHCLLEAKQQQMEVDQRGFNRVFSRINQAASPDTPRTTRRQLRNQQENNIKLVTIKTDASGRIQQEEGI